MQTQYVRYNPFQRFLMWALDRENRWNVAIVSTFVLFAATVFIYNRWWWMSKQEVPTSDLTLAGALTILLVLIGVLVSLFKWLDKRLVVRVHPWRKHRERLVRIVSGTIVETGIAMWKGRGGEIHVINMPQTGETVTFSQSFQRMTDSSLGRLHVTVTYNVVGPFTPAEVFRVIYAAGCSNLTEYVSKVILEAGSSMDMNKLMQLAEGWVRTEAVLREAREHFCVRLPVELGFSNLRFVGVGVSVKRSEWRTASWL